MVKLGSQGLSDPRCLEYAVVYCIEISNKIDDKDWYVKFKSRKICKREEGK